MNTVNTNWLAFQLNLTKEVQRNLSKTVEYFTKDIMMVCHILFTL